MSNNPRIEKLLSSIAVESYLLSGNTIFMDDVAYSIIIFNGIVDIFFTAKDQARFPILGPRALENSIFQGVSPVDSYFFIAVPVANSYCIKVRNSDLEQLCRRDSELQNFYEEGVKLAKISLATTEDNPSEFYLNKLKEHEQLESLRLQKHLTLRQNKLAIAMSKIANVLSPNTPKISGDSPLWCCCQALGETMGIKLQALDINILESLASPEEQLKEICTFNQLRCRAIDLSSRWEKDDVLPFIAFKKTDQTPITILGQYDGRVKYYDPQKGTEEYLKPEMIDDIASQAWIIYEPLPAGKISKFTLLGMALKNSKKELHSILFLSILGSLLAIAVPIINGLIFSEVIPSADRELLLQLFGISLLLAFVYSFFEYIISLQILRVHVRGEYRLQAAVWDRVLNLPTKFFRKYSTGDLASRVLGIMQIGELLTVSTIKSIISGFFCLPAVIMMLYYDLLLAVVSLLLMGGILLILVGCGWRMVSYYSKILYDEGVLNGELIQFFIGISKIRIAGAEDSCFAKWAEKFSEKKELYRTFAKCRNVIVVINSIAPITMTIVVLSIVTWQYFHIKSGEPLMSSSDFIVFVSALGIVSAALTQQSSAALNAITLIPIYQRMKPIFEQETENVANMASSNKLLGSISINEVSFSYEKASKPTLSNLNIEVNQGEFVAIVGESGAGKSTLLRLLLGFENPTSGSICYDGQDISQINPRSLRSQIGVVLQTTRLIPDSILHNIIGRSGSLTIDDAWRAAKLADCAEDILAMPMGMQTLLSAGSGSISGGQRQRLMIARALAKNPAILLFDEATSSLDNETQAAIAESIEKLQVTRVVIAHRLSTIKNADRIYVLAHGEVCEHGNYKQLVAKDGVFAQLVKRQMIGEN